MGEMMNLLQGSTERVGFVLSDGSIVECLNICPDPEMGFDVSDADLARYCDNAVATWHTHPDGTKLLSVGDYETFRTNDELVHFIIAADGVAGYYVEHDMVLNVEDIPND
jgi:proteasome lid subunit RPN8/RPN11